LIIIDTGPLVAAADADDQDHDRCVAMFRGARRPWLVPQPVIAEVCYLLEREHGSKAESADASVVAVAERLNVATVATLNRRDFTVVRPNPGFRPRCGHAWSPSR
jgi:uncharacterized protein